MVIDTQKWTTGRLFGMTGPRYYATWFLAPTPRGGSTLMGQKKTSNLAYIFFAAKGTLPPPQTPQEIFLKLDHPPPLHSPPKLEILEFWLFLKIAQITQISKTKNENDSECSPDCVVKFSISWHKRFCWYQQKTENPASAIKNVTPSSNPFFSKKSNGNPPFRPKKWNPHIF